MVRVQSYAAAGNSTPQMVDVVPGTNVTNTTIMDSKLYCSYRRKLTVPSGSETYMLDLTTDRYPMWGSGPNASPGMIRVHSEKSPEPKIMDLRFLFQVANKIALLYQKFGFSQRNQIAIFNIFNIKKWFILVSLFSARQLFKAK